MSVDHSAQEVASGVWRVGTSMSSADGPDAGISVNAYAISADGQVSFVDTAWWYGRGHEHLDELIGAARAVQGTAGHVILTHTHRDHSGFVNYLAEVTGATPWLHRDEDASFRAMAGFSGLGSADKAEAWYRSHGFTEEFARHMVESRIEDTTIDLSGAEWGGDADVLKVGSRSFEVISSPGHSNGHVCLFEEATGILFSGDALLPRGHGNPHVTVRPLTRFDPLSDYVAALSHIQDLHPTLCLPGHGPAVDDVAGLIDSHLAYVDRKLDVAQGCVDDVPATAFEIARRMPFRGGKRKFDDLVHDELFLAFGDTLARLRRLVTLGRVIASEDPVTRYTLA